ncbi:hypothetical protein [Sphingopyxis sp. EG6]|uniref:hypothetical protein n=1 Tax=Sphingopyxis sp. EG6 TaxID=1874061 RepID=UPI003FA78580
MGILYIGVTDNLSARIFPHRNGTVRHFAGSGNWCSWFTLNLSTGSTKRLPAKRH